MGKTATCGVGNDHRVACWGVGWDKIFSSKDEAQAVPIPHLTEIEGVAVGLMHACAWSATQLQCWGDSPDGELGVAGVTNSATPVRVPISDVVLADATQLGTCALTKAGKIWCWGVLGEHAIGATPREVALRGRATTFDAWEQGACALMEDGSVECWEDPAAVITVEQLPRMVQIEGDGGLSDRGELWWWPQGPAKVDYMAAVRAEPGVYSTTSRGDLGCTLDRAGHVMCFGPECAYPPPAGTSSRDRLRLDFGGPVDAIFTGSQQQVCARPRAGSWSCASCNDDFKLTFAPLPFVPRSCDR